MTPRPLAVAVVLFAVVAATACGGPSKPAEAKAEKPAAAAAATTIRVRTQPVELGSLTDPITITGDLRASVDVMVAAETAGKIERLPWEEGDRVRKGALIAAVDARLADAQLAQADAGVDIAQKTLARLKQLQAEKMATDQQVDQADAQLKQAEAARELARIGRDRATIEAPVSGVITMKAADEGEFAAPGQPLVRIVDPASLKLRVLVSEIDLDSVREGTPAVVRFDAFPELELALKVKHLLPVADEASRHYIAELAVPNTGGRLKSGLTARVTFVRREAKKAVVVHQDWVLDRGEGPTVFVVAGDKAAARRVTLGLIAQGRAVVTNGLAAGETIIVEGHRLVTDGQPVVVVR